MCAVGDRVSCRKNSRLDLDAAIDCAKRFIIDGHGGPDYGDTKPCDELGDDAHQDAGSGNGRFQGSLPKRLRMTWVT
jgi:hypothetical protein